MDFGFGAIIGAILMYIVRPYLSAYSSKKGENLATIEAISKITDKIEEVRTDYAKQILEVTHQNTLLVEAFRAESSLRLAAAEKRLEAHQQAFALWRKLVTIIHTPERYSVIQECERWWNENCLYLSPNARQAFFDAYWSAHAHRAYLETNASSEVIMKNMNKIENAGNKIVEGAELPPLGEIESKLLSGTNPVSPSQIKS
ncbi:MAG: hypothetical protein A3J35_07400 [Gammaproteobacteria bacterium RIFCSPLOWO2_02_FULL_52_10]|nr:MAG: hypothetical protein A3J35_07400 [Gammaproteobacteria bacterium RIFCSPLOWO2_02_FULL_52_10]